jgi:nucleotide-binding universal stress UspA family protein
MIETILIPVDDSPFVQAALTTALRVANACEPTSTIEALYVLSVSGPTGKIVQDLAGMMGFEPILVPQAVEQWFEKKGEGLLSDVEQVCASEDVPFRRHMDKGAALDRLLHRALAVDLLIAGVGQDQEVAIFGQGGVAVERMLRRIGTTVILVPEAPVQFTGIVLAFDGSAGAQCALRSTRRLARLLSIPVLVAYVADERRSETFAPLHEAVDSLEKLGVEVSSVTLHGEPHECLLAEAQGRGYDLISIGSRGRSGITGRVLGRVTEAIVDDMSVAIMLSR